MSNRTLNPLTDDYLKTLIVADMKIDFDLELEPNNIPDFLIEGKRLEVKTSRLRGDLIAKVLDENDCVYEFKGDVISMDNEELNKISDIGIKVHIEKYLIEEGESTNTQLKR